MVKYYILLLIMTIIGAVASLFFKQASNSKSIMELIKNKKIYIGGALYAASAIINIIVLKYINYSIVLPLTSMTYVWTLIISYYLLNEKISVKKLIGIISIIIGALFITFKI